MGRDSACDLIVFGASGFTGRLVAEYIAGKYGDKIKWGMAGRDLEKLAAVRAEIGAPGDTLLIKADSDDEESLHALARSTRAVISTVGPFQLFGSKLVAVCARAGTDYLDLSGETVWMRSMIDAHENEARSSGARIIFSCGFDSVPFELGVFFLQGAARKAWGEAAERVKGRVRVMKGTFSGGTAASSRATMAAAMIPHVDWVRSVEYAPFRYAGDTYKISSRWESLQLAWGYVGHNVALLLLPLVLAAAVLAWSPRWWVSVARDPRAFVKRPWSLTTNPGVRTDQALNIWLIQAIVAIGPPIGALLFDIYIKTDWGISLFFLVPLAVIAIPSLKVPRVALVRLAAIWLVLSLVTLAAAPQIAIASLPRDANGNFAHISYSQLARELTEVWHKRFHTRWSNVVGFVDVAEQMTFYSPDHPLPLTPYEPWPSGVTSMDEARRNGFIGICLVGDWKFDRCEAWMKDNLPNAERIVMSTRRFFKGNVGTTTRWNVYVVAPGAMK